MCGIEEKVENSASGRGARRGVGKRDVVKYGKLIGRFKKLDKEKNVFYSTHHTQYWVIVSHFSRVLPTPLHSHGELYCSYIGRYTDLIVQGHLESRNTFGMVLKCSVIGVHVLESTSHVPSIVPVVPLYHSV